MSLTGPSGGLAYHTRALRHAEDLWAPFRTAVGCWLRDWAPAASTLILIGPSAGYCLDTAFLARFARLVALDPDPLAPRFFRRRHANALSTGTELQWIAHDHFSTGDHVGLSALITAHAEAAVLLCNFLGQLHLVLPREKTDTLLAHWRESLPRLLADHPWASFHDRVSGALPLDFKQPMQLPARLDDEALLDRFYASREGKLVDHHTNGFFTAQQPHSYLHWQLSPRRWHLIEAVCNPAVGPAVRAS